MVIRQGEGGRERGVSRWGIAGIAAAAAAVPRANYKPAYVAHIIILLLVLLSKLTLRVYAEMPHCVCVCVYVCVSLPHVPLNAFINASPWPNSQHLFPTPCHIHAYIILHT